MSLPQQMKAAEFFESITVKARELNISVIRRLEDVIGAKQVDNLSLMGDDMYYWFISVDFRALVVNGMDMCLKANAAYEAEQLQGVADQKVA